MQDDAKLDKMTDENMNMKMKWEWKLWRLSTNAAVYKLVEQYTNEMIVW